MTETLADGFLDIFHADHLLQFGPGRALIPQLGRTEAEQVRLGEVYLLGRSRCPLRLLGLDPLRAPPLHLSHRFHDGIDGFQASLGRHTRDKPS